MMDDATRNDILAMARRAHDVTESAYQQHASARGTPGWDGKQRILLADMALHLLQTALGDGDLSTDMLRRNLYAILTVADQFIPEAGLKGSAARLLQQEGSSNGPAG